ncbi:MAG: hypothetical protein JW751_08275 [Polyangiaceae bacterium]|nr:hypothetical protein [Polyangiaceae bacterium]
MDLVDRIETSRFLGSEFLTWLWFKIELFEGTFDIGELGSTEVWFDTAMALVGWVDEGEKITLRGTAPSSTPEAAEALRQGKVPHKASLRMVVGGNEEYVFTFNARAFSVSGVKIPAILTEAAEEQFYERMRLLEQLDELIVSLYDEFVLLRLSPLWDGEVAPAMREWVRGKESLTPRSYAGLVQRALAQRDAGARKKRK